MAAPTPPLPTWAVSSPPSLTRHQRQVDWEARALVGALEALIRDARPTTACYEADVTNLTLEASAQVRHSYLAKGWEAIELESTTPVRRSLRLRDPGVQTGNTMYIRVEVPR